MYIIENNKGYKTIKSYYEVVSGKADVYLDIPPNLFNFFTNN
jgi:hypothetical protein